MGTRYIYGKGRSISDEEIDEISEGFFEMLKRELREETLCIEVIYLILENIKQDVKQKSFAYNNFSAIFCNACTQIIGDVKEYIKKIRRNKR